MSWDGRDDSGNAVPSGTYQIRVLINNVKYAWDGLVGNTSSSFRGDHVWRSYADLEGSGSLAIAGSRAFLGIGYIEGQSSVRRFQVNAPQSPSDAFPTNPGAVWTLMATDGTRLYVADTGSGWDNNSSSFVTSYNVPDGSAAQFSAGTNVWTTAPFATEYNAIDVAQEPGTSYDSAFESLHAATGLSVQRSGSLLAVAHQGLNVVRLFDKTSGVPRGTISVPSPGSIAFDRNGDLWVLTGKRAVRYTNLPNSPAPAAGIGGLSSPISIATDPNNVNVVLIADGGSNQRLLAFDRLGAASWTYGLAGGYALNGPTVRNDVFQFNGGRVAMAFGDDGSFWVADGATNRLLHISSSRSYIEQVAFTPGSYMGAVDDNNPERVFEGFLEYAVDYSKPLEPGDPSASNGNGCWKLVRNWAAGLPSKYFRDNWLWGFSGLKAVYTLSNGRTYGLVPDWSQLGNAKEVMELTTSGLRDTGLVVQWGQTFYPDGSLRWQRTSQGRQTIYESRLTGFDSSGNPQWGAAFALASYPATGQNAAVSPGQIGDMRFPMTSSGLLVTYNTTNPYCTGDLGGNTTGMHLGAVAPGNSDFTWQASPSVPSDNPFDGLGSFDVGDGISYAGSNVFACGRSIVYGFPGEFWGGAEADQFMHFWDDGLFVGQFGTPGDTSIPDGYSVPGEGGNEFSPWLVTAKNGESYLYTPDEAEHGGLQRWHLVGARSIRELSGSATLGHSVTLTMPNSPVASGLRAAVASTGQVALSWSPNPLTRYYSIAYATNSGGPYSLLESKVRGNSYVTSGLTVGTRYFFVVSPMSGSASLNPSDEVSAIPVDPNVPVCAAGQLAYTKTYGLNPIIDSTALYPYELETSASILGDLSVTRLGRGGYCLFDYPTTGVMSRHLSTGVSVSLVSGWNSDTPWISGKLVVDGLTGPRNALAPRDLSWIYPSTQDAVFNVDPGDQAWHYLTILSPPNFADGRSFQVRVTPRGLQAPAAVETVNDPSGHGCTHLLQFLIKGPVTVTVPAGAMEATLQGVFLDPVDGN